MTRQDAGGAGSVVTLYDLASRRRVAELRWVPKGMNMLNYGVQISPDRRWLVEKSQSMRWLDKVKEEASLKEQVLVVWELPGRAKLAELRAGPSANYLGDNDTDVAFSPDSRLLAVADGGPEVVLWDLDQRKWRRTLCEMVDRDLTGQERRRFLRGEPAEPVCQG